LIFFFSPPRTISEFIQLETLILDNINTNSVCQIFQELMSLINLHSLSLNIAEYVESSNELFAKLFLLPELNSVFNSNLKQSTLRYFEYIAKVPFGTLF
jgi:hypothetical protein